MRNSSLHAPLLSVIVPTYNRDSLLEETLLSIANQINDSIEVLVIDDGSAPKVEEQVLKFKLANFKYHYQENQGRSAARNKGIEKSLGEYLFFLDDDDLMHPEFIDNFINCSPKEEVLVFKYEMLYLNGTNRKTYIPGAADTFFKKYILDSYALSAFVFSRKALGKKRFTPNAFIGEDFNFIFNLLNSYKVRCIEAFSVLVQMHDSQTTVKKYGVNKDKVYTQLKKNILDPLKKQNSNLPISAAELSRFIQMNLDEMLQGLAMHNLNFAKKTKMLAQLDFPEYRPISNLTLLSFKLRGIVKGLLRSE